MSALVPTPLRRAVAFAMATNRGGVQAWMRWEGWVQHVGCYECANDGPAAGCWGVEGCHGFEQDCGCTACVEIEQEELQAERARSLQALTADIARPALRDELALVGERIDQPMDGRAG